jgi:hypothetical protein
VLDQLKVILFAVSDVNSYLFLFFMSQSSSGSSSIPITFCEPRVGASCERFIFKAFSGNLAFDPLRARGGRKKTTAAPTSSSAAPMPAGSDQNNEKYDVDEVNDMSAGLSHLLAELARGKHAPMFLSPPASTFVHLKN